MALAKVNAAELKQKNSKEHYVLDLATDSSPDQMLEVLKVNAPMLSRSQVRDISRAESLVCHT